jgi:hypothetical protein
MMEISSGIVDILALLLVRVSGTAALVVVRELKLLFSDYTMV